MWDIISQHLRMENVHKRESSCYHLLIDIVFSVYTWVCLWALYSLLLISTTLMELILYPMRKNKVNLKNYFDINAEQTTNFNKVAYHLAVLVFVEAEK